MKELKVKITFDEMVLGSTPSDPEVAKEFIAQKAPTEALVAEEAGVLDDINEVVEDEKGITVFPRLEDDTPFLWDYQVRGFFKSACQALNMADAKTKLAAFKKKIDLLVFVKERKIPYILPEGGVIGTLQRPLRASTARGERIALACSETIPAGTTAEFTICVMEDSLLNRVKDWLDYGAYNGLGQWRNASYGRFHWEEVA